ncbi:MAG TPA: hypothetical protein VHB98_24760 [Chloroflexota bacterium]|nr:hypothetical protein [Chloroflexota bacterium]
MQVNGTTTASASYDAADQVVGWSYDPAGNLTSDGSTTYYSYDALNRLTGTTATGQTRSYGYNGDGTLVSRTANGTSTTYTQDLAAGQSQVLASTSGGSTTDYLVDANASRLATLGAEYAPGMGWTGTAACGGWWTMAGTCRAPSHYLYQQAQHGFGLFSVILKTNALLIGDCGLDRMNVGCPWCAPCRRR